MSVRLWNGRNMFHVFWSKLNSDFLPQVWDYFQHSGELIESATTWVQNACRSSCRINTTESSTSYIQETVTSGSEREEKKAIIRVEPETVMMNSKQFTHQTSKLQSYPEFILKMDGVSLFSSEMQLRTLTFSVHWWCGWLRRVSLSVRVKGWPKCCGFFRSTCGIFLDKFCQLTDKLPKDESLAILECWWLSV